MKKLHRFIAVLLCCTCIMGLTQANVVYADANKDELDKLNSQYAQLQKEQKELQEKINSAKNEKDKQLAKKKQLDAQMNNTQQQIKLLSNRIAILGQDIETQEAAIVNKQADIDETYSKFKGRMRVSYMAGDASSMSLLLGADSFSDFLSKAEITSRIAKSDNDMIALLTEDLRLLNEIKAQIEQDKADVESSKKDMDAKKTQLNGQISDVQASIQDLTQLENQIKNDKAAVDKMMKAAEAEIAELLRGHESVGPYTGGIMLWPVPYTSVITSYYGWRFNNTDFHTGIDISASGVYRKPILAAADGEVVVAQQSYVPGVAYGRYLMIDHGGNVSTLYGHTDELLVKVGDKVKRGQTIALVGTTGWSTGPHLHFEVRENNKAVNPLGKYIKK